MTDETKVLPPEQVDGYTIEQLSTYLDAGRSPRDPAIEDSPSCQAVLDGMERLRALSRPMLHADATNTPPIDQGWFSGVLSAIARDSRTGRVVRLDPTNDTDLVITESAVRSVIRSAERAVTGALIGRIRFLGDITAGGAVGEVEIDVALPYGTSLTTAADTVRSAIADNVERHALLTFASIDVAVHDITRPPAQLGGETLQ